MAKTTESSPAPTGPPTAVSPTPEGPLRPPGDPPDSLQRFQARTPTHTLRIDFDDAQAQAILRYTRDAVGAAVQGKAFDQHLPGDLHESPAFGLFVTLRRPTLLRACRGRWGGGLHPLGPLLAQVSHDAATLDPRFPTVTAQELPRLAIDVSLMFDPNMVQAVGEDRLNAIEIGTHGLVIDHPRGQGLLLPHVATEAGWNAKAFLDHLAQKAGLPPDTWRRDPAAKLMTFRTCLLISEAPKSELDTQQLPAERMNRLLSAANRMVRDQPFEDQLDPILTDAHEEELGVHLHTETGTTAAAIGHGHSLLELLCAAIQSLKDLCTQRPTPLSGVKRLAILWQPVGLVAQDYPDRHQLLASCAVLTRYDRQWQLVLPDRTQRYDMVGQAMRSMAMTCQDWADRSKQGQLTMTAFTVLNFESREKPNGSITRAPAHSGRFYPDDPAQMNQAIDAHLRVGEADAKAKGVAQTDCRAIMLPHAGWVFCGDTIGKVLARVRVPETVIVIGPKHTTAGPTWSVAPHQRWDIPGGSVPIATDLAQQLFQRIPRIDCEPAAHRDEHGCEVLLPLLQCVQPKLRVLPIVMGQTPYEATTPLAAALAQLIGPLDPAPLLVISSDMNHFATESENRRLDRMALDAMLTADPRALYEACELNQISMCGLLPAVTVMQALSHTKPLDMELVDYCNSAKVTGDTSRVVGYGAVVIR